MTTDAPPRVASARANGSDGGVMGRPIYMDYMDYIGYMAYPTASGQVLARARG